MLAGLVGGGQAHGQKPDWLAQASLAWDAGRRADAAPYYERSLRDGVLFPGDLVFVYVRLGTAKLEQGNRDEALGAFRNAMIIDPDFELPPDCGPKPRPLFEQAQREARARNSQLFLTVGVPDKIVEGKPFFVRAQIPTDFAPISERFSIETKEGPTKGYTWSTTLSAQGGGARFEVPAKVARQGTVWVRISALDAHGNRWTVHEFPVTVQPPPSAAPAVAAAPKPVAPSLGREKEQGGGGGGGGFWSSPWPYLVAGALVAGGAGAYFFATRPPDQVTVGAPTWR
ncbi:MAG TPA: tetratricopeptide repeat protein [Polyangiaceae bacterium]|nr:tetratricopeptide repeat protein [Polyangiaceae bacterium]